MAGFTVTKPPLKSSGTSLNGIKIAGSGASASTNVKVTITNNGVPQSSAYAYQAYTGSNSSATTLWAGSNGSAVTSVQTGKEALTLFFYPQFMNPASEGSPSSYTGYDTVSVATDGQSATLISSTYPSANITISIVDAGSGGPPMA